MKGVAFFDEYPGPVLGHHPDLLVGLARAAVSVTHGAPVHVNCPPSYLARTGLLDGIEVNPTVGRRFPVDVALAAHNFDEACGRARSAGIGVVINLFFDESHAAVPLEDVGVKFVHVVHRPGELPQTADVRHRLSTLAERDAFVVHTERGRSALLMLMPDCSVRFVPWPAATEADVIARFAEAVPSSSRDLLLIGGARHDKGIDVLLDALAKPAGGPPLYIVGENTTIDAQHLVARTDMVDVTWQREWVGADTIEDAIRRAAVVVFPYLTDFGAHSGSSGALALARTFAKPLIVSDVLAPDLLSDAGCLVVRAGDPAALRRAIDRALGQVAKLHTAAQSARDAVLRGHTFEGHLRQMLGAIR